MAIWVGLVGAMLVGAVACSTQQNVQMGGPPPVSSPAPPPPPTPVDDDKDGILGEADKCPSEAEDGLPPDPKDGCKSQDPDGDGVAGDADKCPDKAETKNSFEDEDGCPDEPPSAVAVHADRVEIKEQIRFETGKDAIDHASDKLIETIAKALKDNPDIDYVEIAGHADKRGADAANKTLTQKRSEAVIAELVKDGVDKNRLRGVGYGSLCLLDKGDSEEAHGKNRRVEFVVLRRGGVDLSTHWGGCPEAAKQGMKAQAIPATAPRSQAKTVVAVKVRREAGKVVQQGTIIVLPDNVNFKPGTTDFQPGAEDLLKMLKEHLDQNQQLSKLRIEGHAADAKNSPRLQKLSENRARTVVAWLVKNGISKDRLFAVGCGANRPIMENGKRDSKESMRVEPHVVETSGKVEAGEPVVPGDCVPVD